MVSLYSNYFEKQNMHIENNIAALLKKGDTKAFEQVFNRYYNQLYTFILRTLFDKNFAEDLTQSVFVALWENRAKIDPDKNIENYLYTIARNKVYRQTERLLLKLKHEEYLKENPMSHPNIEDEVHSKFLENILFELIEELPKQRRKVFLMSRKENLSNKEIAKQLAISEKTVETQLRRSLLFLKQKMHYYLTLSLLF